MALSKEGRLQIAIILSCIFMLVEAVGGYVAHSIAIYSDAAHLLTDVAGFAISLLSIQVSKAKPSSTFHFGVGRIEVLGAFISVLFLWLICLFLIYEACMRGYKWFEGKGEPINGKLMFMIAVFGVLVNLCLGAVFHQEHGASLGHSHEHGHACGEVQHVNVDDSKKGNHNYTKVSTSSTHDVEESHADCDHTGHDHSHGHKHEHEQKQKLKHDRGHDHEHEHGHGHACEHGHGAGHEHSTTHTEHSAIEMTSYQNSSSGHADSHHGHDVNLEAAYLHVLTDLMQSTGVAVAGLVIWYKPHWAIVDPILTLLFSCVCIHTTLPITRRICLIFLEATPPHINWDTIYNRFMSIPSVLDVHDLHIWSISNDSVSLTSHIQASDPQTVLKAAEKICKEYGISHTTIQIQQNPCCDDHDESNHKCYSRSV